MKNIFEQHRQGLGPAAADACRLDSARTWPSRSRHLGFIALTAAATGDLPEAVRRWSEQIEYDTDNVALLKKAAAAGEF